MREWSLRNQLRTSGVGQKEVAGVPRHRLVLKRLANVHPKHWKRHQQNIVLAARWGQQESQPLVQTALLRSVSPNVGMFCQPLACDRWCQPTSLGMKRKGSATAASICSNETPAVHLTT